ncbi:GIY-YIG nuclease family protein [Marinobacter sp. DY40_1A1]|uniref:GIY-YIG nuclease family protein n=1 Tax=Marinobacter sp. DY40_1A1 TaxID=2583229 RepID=UPI001906E509|nr:GIY-YIG nuclease family protein [Marinobacter sp. DY40_1A1]MBK1885623.1 GIY-YIG nuclease family protein [Marinobacter sp. DY40_1A1]
MINNKGQSLELFFIDGKPDGMLTAEVFNWTGHVLMAPRTRIGAALKRPTASYTGVYLLLGEDDEGPLAYIGEGEDIGDRIKSHDTSKDWWTSVVLITTAGNNLNKAHAKYLESRLVEEARKAGKIRLDNGNTPPRSSLSESAQANMESFLEYLMMVLPALRIDSFLAQTRPQARASMGSAVSDDDLDIVFELRTPKHGIDAKAVLTEGEFVVLAGSRVSPEWRGKTTHHTGYSKLHGELVAGGVIRPEGELSVFSENYAFRSPSAAAAVVNGRPTNGTTEWRLPEGKTYKAWEKEKLEQDEGA